MYENNEIEVQFTDLHYSMYVLYKTEVGYLNLSMVFYIGIALFITFMLYISALVSDDVDYVSEKGKQ